MRRIGRDSGGLSGWLRSGLIAGAAGTTALNAVTYLDMALRGRPGSTTPEQTVQRIEQLTHQSLDMPGAEEAAEHRRTGIGALLGIATGLGSGLAYGVARNALSSAPLPAMVLIASAAANLGSVVPMACLGVTDPRRWPASAWLSDLVPHLAYGVVAAIVYEELRRFG